MYQGVICEDNVFIGPSAVFTNVMNPRAAVVRKNEYHPTLVRKGATIGANATIVCGVEIGQYAFVGAGTVVLTHVPAHALWVGNPGRQAGWMSEEGHRLYFNETDRYFCEDEQTWYKIQENKVSKENE